MPSSIMRSIPIHSCNGGAGGSVGVAGSPAPGAGCLEYACSPLPIMHRPSAHIAMQGAAETSSGATPTAAIQFHPSARPAPAIATPAIARTRRSPIQDRNMPARSGVDARAGCFAISILGIVALQGVSH
jgi:hypothetical protein